MKRDICTFFKDLLKICLKNNPDNITIYENNEAINLYYCCRTSHQLDKTSSTIVSRTAGLTTEMSRSLNLETHYSLISEILENYSIIPRTREIYNGDIKTELQELYLDDGKMSLQLKTLDDKKIPTRSDTILINHTDSRYPKNIQTFQEILDENYMIITTVYDPKEKPAAIRKTIEVYDKKATIDILKSEDINIPYKPDLTREIEIIHVVDDIYALSDYEVLDHNIKNLLNYYELKSDRNINEIASLYVKQLELEKLVERPIDFKKYRIKK